MTSSVVEPRAANASALTETQEAVLRAFYDFGAPMDDLALATYVHHIQDEPMSSSSIRSRRAELSRGPKPLLNVTRTKRLRSGRSAAVHSLTAEGRKIAKLLFS